MSNNVTYIITPGNISVTINGETHLVSRSTELAEKLMQAIVAKEIDRIPELISVGAQINHKGKGLFEVKGGDIYVKGKICPPMLGTKILAFANEDLPFEPLVKFAEKLHQNPSTNSVNSLFTFLEKNDHPITDDGDFIAYKRVGNDFKDLYTHTMDNSVGKTLEMPRENVNPDSNVTCSTGLHVANWHYANSCYGNGQGKMLLVSVNPKDVVAVPYDYDNAKMRVCKYTVLEVVSEELATKTLRNNKSVAVPSPHNTAEVLSCEEDEDVEEDEDLDEDDDYDDYDTF